MNKREMKRPARDNSRVIDDFGECGTVQALLAGGDERCLVLWDCDASPEEGKANLATVHHARIQFFEN